MTGLEFAAGQGCAATVAGGTDSAARPPAPAPAGRRTMPPMLEVDRVAKRYQDTLAVNDASFTARPGRILGLVGPNGAGKTSILRMINNITKPDTGEVRLDGETVSRAVQHRIGYMPEERGLYKQVKVIDQITYIARLKGLSKPAAGAAARDWLRTLQAEHFQGKRPTELSKGMQQKVQFALALVHEPRLIVLDEPFGGLDPINSALMEDVIGRCKDAGGIVLFASHRMEQVEQLCDDICLIAGGRICISGELAAVRRRFGRNAVELGCDGDTGFLERLVAEGKVQVRSEGRDSLKLRLAEGYAPEALLDAARSAGATLRLFTANYPSLREIFVHVVGGGDAEAGAVDHPDGGES